MNAYGWIIALHAAIAVLGTGQLAAIAIVAKAGREGTAAARTIPIIGKLASTATWSLVLLLLTGALAMYVGTAFFLQMWWLRISMVLFLVLGALSGQVRRAVRHGDEASLPRIERLAWAMCVLLFAIVVLMETKPW